MGGEVPSGGVRVLLGGGIGSGKSTVSALFAARGFAVIVADEIGHDVLEVEAARSEVGSLWPSVIVDDGLVDRGRLASIVFADTAELHRLEAITHPLIASEIGRRVAAAGSDRILVEVPLIDVFPGEGFVRIAVVADRDVRFARVVTRGSDPSDVERRMAAQVDDDEWGAWADEVIENSGSWATTERAVTAIIDRLVDGG